MNVPQIFNHPVADEVALGLGLILISVIVHYILRRTLLAAIRKIVVQTRITWDQVLFEKGVFNSLPSLLPAAILYQGAFLIPSITAPAQRLVSLWIFYIVFLALDRLLNAGLAIYNQYPISRRRPLKGYVQIVKLIMYIAAILIGISVLLNQSPWLLLSGLGALSAVLLLVFRDTILSFITSLQLISNDLVRVGDWIEMPQYGANGDVVEMALHSIKIRNWDATVTVIPTYKFSEDSFKNYRSMQESGGRRIMRSLFVDLSSLHFLNEEEIANLQRIRYLRDYIAEKREELRRYNEENEIDTSVVVNGRRMTNIGTFRAYIENYLRHHPGISQDRTLMVRQLQPTPEGLPLEIYAFTNDTVWANYEKIQADIFDHILTVVPEFGLKVYQKPSGQDLREAVQARQP